MDINYYKVYPISQLNSINWELFTHSAETCRKSVDGTEFIVKFKNKPHANTITLTQDEAINLMSTINWNTDYED